MTPRAREAAKAAARRRGRMPADGSASNPLLQPAGRNQALRTEEKNERHGDEDERLAKGAQVGRQEGLQQDRGRPNEEAAERGSGQAAETADDGADEGDDRPAAGPSAAAPRRSATTIRQETAAARTPLSAKATAITRFARTPSTRAMRKSSAAARICRPSRVALRNQVRAARSTSADDDRDDLQELQADAGELDLATKLGQEVERPSAASRRPGSRSFCRKKLTANEEIKSVVGSALRSGRKAARSVTSARTTATAMPPNDHDRHGLAEEREQRIGGEGDQLAMGEIDQPHDPENQADAERGQRVEAADADCIGQDLDADAPSRSACRLAHVHAEIGGVEARMASDLAGVAG